MIEAQSTTDIGGILMADLNEQVPALPADSTRFCPKHKVQLTPAGKQGELRCRKCSADRMQSWRIKNIPNYGHRPGRVRAQAACHPDRPHVAKGLCKKCYDATYQAANREQHNKNARAYVRRNPDSRANTVREYRYGISSERVEQQFKEQDGLCAICHVAPAEHLDHDHKTKQMRGLLCCSCNWGLGHFKDNPSFLLSAVLYLSAGKVQ